MIAIDSILVMSNIEYTVKQFYIKINESGSYEGYITLEDSINKLTKPYVVWMILDLLKTGDLYPIELKESMESIKKKLDKR